MEPEKKTVLTDVYNCQLIGWLVVSIEVLVGADQAKP